MYHPFSVTETISVAWQILKKNFATIAVYTLIAAVIFIATPFILNFILFDVIVASIGVIIYIICISFVYLGFIKLVFQFIDKEYYDFDFADIIPRIKMLGSYIVLLIIVSTLAVFITEAIKQLDDGLVKSLLGIISAVVVEIFFLFYFPICACFMVDDNSGPFESVAQSFQLIRGNFLKYFVLFIFIEVLVVIGSLLIVGLIFVVPFVNILLVVAYRKLIYSHLDVDDEVTETL